MSRSLLISPWSLSQHESLSFQTSFQDLIVSTQILHHQCQPPLSPLTNLKSTILQLMLVSLATVARFSFNMKRCSHFSQNFQNILEDLIDVAIRLDSRMELHRWVRGQFSRHRAELFDSPSAPWVPEPSNGVEPMQVGRMHLSAKTTTLF